MPSHSAISRRAALLLLAGAAAAPARADGRDDALQRLAHAFVREQRLPGAVLGVRGPGLDAVLASGVLDRSTTARVTPQSRFYVASAGKMITATAILQLVDQGRIRLDQPASAILVP